MWGNTPTRRANLQHGHTCRNSMCLLEWQNILEMWVSRSFQRLCLYRRTVPIAAPSWRQIFQCRGSRLSWRHRGWQGQQNPAKTECGRGDEHLQGAGREGCRAGHRALQCTLAGWPIKSHWWRFADGHLSSALGQTEKNVMAPPNHRAVGGGRES